MGAPLQQAFNTAVHTGTGRANPQTRGDFWMWFKARGAFEVTAQFVLQGVTFRYRPVPRMLDQPVRVDECCGGLFNQLHDPLFPVFGLLPVALQCLL